MIANRKVLIVAYAGQGHINPALQFANRLVKMGVQVTFSSSVSIIRRLDNEGTPHDLTFAPFSDGHDNGKQPTTTLEQFVSDFSNYGSRAIVDIISSAAASGQPFNHLIYTTFIPWAARIANTHGIKSTVLWCQSATILDIYYYYFNGYQGLMSCNKNNSTFPIKLPGLPQLTTDDLPSFMLPSNPREHKFVLPIFKEHIDVLRTAPRILANTFNELEVESIKAIQDLVFIPIGPLIPSKILDGKDSSDKTMGRDFFEKPENEYIQWLKTKPKSSVVYVSFGTIATFLMDQLEEIATGLLETHRPFLWVIRDSEQAGRLSKIEELKEHGMIVSWCPQMMVLSHEAIGCFVTHGGWNSTLETLVAGVPTVVFPQWTDQATNAKMMEDVWRSGVKVRRREGDGFLEGKEIARCVEMVMTDDDMKTNTRKWRELAKDALKDGKPSTINLQAFLDDF